MEFFLNSKASLFNIYEKVQFSYLLEDCKEIKLFINYRQEL